MQVGHQQPQLSGHPVERVGESADLVLAYDGGAKIELPIRDASGRVGKLGKRPHDPPGEAEAREDRQRRGCQADPGYDPQRPPGGRQSLGLLLLGHQAHVQTGDPGVDSDDLVAGI